MCSQPRTIALSEVEATHFRGLSEASRSLMVTLAELSEAGYG